MSRYRWEFEMHGVTQSCILRDQSEIIGFIIGPTTAQRVVDALNAYDAATTHSRRHVQQELTREQAARDDGCDPVDGAPV